MGKIDESAVLTDTFGFNGNGALSQLAESGLPELPNDTSRVRVWPVDSRCAGRAVGASTTHENFRRQAHGGSDRVLREEDSPGARREVLLMPLRQGREGEGRLLPRHARGHPQGR